ncbi:3-deoxy-manno-octulosonate cytidylyltransferase [Erythrobacter sp. sf7]|uniref:3-deoxy-manno-octulosonate cytidylyltransferase n=1 Tax=Erythrobacter fulvus TaxID=2987523 RepID=A0ABT5JMM7_9SPHN|nr:3-deoxy-manno-octulosonate cytidylyltransferase [Erythrobacter fulvus]MDC8753771.1 3-deoxy-manno-octulosonate cytidylyltransferase [Erythrobacter fulvus]
MHRILVIIPARLASTRFPAKPLAELRGADGIARPALHYTWQAGLAAVRLLGPDAGCIIATDDDRIAAVARANEMAVVMTPEACANGTERCAAALSALGYSPELVVNLQGDAPLTPASMVAELVALIESEPQFAMATAAVPASPAVLAHLQADAAAGRVGGTTVVCSSAGRALYFSKSIIPHVLPGTTPRESVLLHLGLYAYRPEALLSYTVHGAAPIELQEGLEQLRFLDAGLPVGVAVCEAPAWEMIELNNPTDVPLIEAELARRAAMESV